ncbi:hypothetical protein SMICM17S_12531 [Streptomyces microflavus]
MALSLRTASRSAFGILAKASLVGANTVMFSALLRVSTRPAFCTAVTSVESAGLLEAAVATGSFAMPSKLPAPSVGTPAQAGPNGLSADVSSPAAGFDSSGVEPAADALSDALSELSSAQAVSDRGSRTAATTATAARRWRRAFMEFS